MTRLEYELQVVPHFPNVPLFSWDSFGKIQKLRYKRMKPEKLIAQIAAEIFTVGTVIQSQMDVPF